jgi:hypothetical protein
MCPDDNEKYSVFGGEPLFPSNVFQVRLIGFVPILAHVFKSDRLPIMADLRVPSVKFETFHPLRALARLKGSAQVVCQDYPDLHFLEVDTSGTSSITGDKGACVPMEVKPADLAFAVRFALLSGSRGPFHADELEGVLRQFRV